MQRSDEMRAVLEARAYAYLMLQSLLGDEPTAERLVAACGEASRDALGLFTAGGSAAYAGALRNLEAAMAGIAGALSGKGDDEAVDKLKGEYTRLFIGPAKLDAPPWESMYVTKEKVLFQEHTLKVRNAYRAQGFLPAEYPRVADDHVALECAFMAKLAARAKDAFESGDDEILVGALAASLGFLRDHLLAWMPDYAADLAKAEEGRFYPKLAALALELMRVDEGLLAELLFGKDVASATR